MKNDEIRMAHEDQIIGVPAAEVCFVSRQSDLVFCQLL